MITNELGIVQKKENECTLDTQCFCLISSVYLLISSRTVWLTSVYGVEFIRSEFQIRVRMQKSIKHLHSTRTTQRNTTHMHVITPSTCILC